MDSSKQVVQYPVAGMSGSTGELSEELVMQEKQKKGWRMNCDVGEATEGLENELWYRWSDGKVGEWAEQHDYNGRMKKLNNFTARIHYY